MRTHEPDAWTPSKVCIEHGVPARILLNDTEQKHERMNKNLDSKAFLKSWLKIWHRDGKPIEKNRMHII